MTEGIMLVNTPFYMDERVATVPLGLASIAGDLEANGYKGRVSVFDGCHYGKKYGYGDNVWEALKEKMKSEKPFIVGCNLHSHDFLQSLVASCFAFEEGADVVLGGHEATIYHKPIAKYFNDVRKTKKTESTLAIVRGDGEKTMRELSDVLYSGKDLHDVKGITFLDKDEVVVNPEREPVSLDDLHPPSFHLFPQFSEELYFYPVEESRGCVFECSFCSISENYHGYRLKSARKIVDEAKKAAEYGAKEIDLAGELVLLDRERALEIADGINSLGLDWSINAHVSLILKQKEILPILKSKRLVCVETGIESNTMNSLRVFNKKSTPKMNHDALSALRKSGIDACADFITFQPYMNMRDLYSNIIFIAKNLPLFFNRSDYPTNIGHKWAPSHGTQLYERAEKDGLVAHKDWNDMRCKFKSRKVARASNSFAYFLDNYLKPYRERKKLVFGICDRDHNGQEVYKDKRLDSVVKIPIEAMYISHMCSMARVPAEKHIDRLVELSFAAIDSGNLQPPEKSLFLVVTDEIKNEIETKK